MAKRKTVEVESIKTMVNSCLRNSIKQCVDIRRGYMALMEQVLHDTGNYKGFRYLSQHEVPAGSLPGIQYHHEYRWDRFKDTDETRIEYY